jgi:CheY-like chemotaxis protein
MLNECTAPHTLRRAECYLQKRLQILRGKKVTVLVLPIVALTPNALVENKYEALKAGATEFATKPIVRNNLHILYGRYLLLA